jgi:pyruvate,water dikinase
VIEGPVRVLRSEKDLGDLQPGEILVCAITAPSWASAFSVAAGVVTDIGGMMSHAAIVLPRVRPARRRRHRLRDDVAADRPAGPRRRRLRCGDDARRWERLMYTTRFDESLCLEVGAVGGKALGLAEMTAAGLPVAPGFTVCTAAYRSYLVGVGAAGGDRGGPRRMTPGHPDAARTAERRSPPRSPRRTSRRNVATAVTEQYQALCARVACPTSASPCAPAPPPRTPPAPASPASFETYIDISGTDDVLAHVRRCWDSVFTGRALAYALDKGLSPLDIEMAVVVQKTVRARAAGVMFTLSPVTGDRFPHRARGQLGLGLSVVGGEVTPDRYNRRQDRDDRQRAGSRRQAPRVPPRRRPGPRAGGALVTAVPVGQQVLALAKLGKALERLQNARRTSSSPSTRTCRRART